MRSTSTSPGLASTGCTWRRDTTSDQQIAATMQATAAAQDRFLACVRTLSDLQSGRDSADESFRRAAGRARAKLERIDKRSHNRDLPAPNPPRASGDSEILPGLAAQGEAVQGGTIAQKRDRDE